MKLFKAEKNVLSSLLQTWYEKVKGFTERANGIFSSKGKMYDQVSPVWERVQWPFGFIHEITKKANRVEQLCSTFSCNDVKKSVNWDEVDEELIDIVNYCRMLGALTEMVREEE